MFTVIKFTLQKVRQSGPTIFYGFVFLSVFYSILSFLTTLIFKEIVDTASGTQTILHLDIWGILIFQAGFQVFASIISGLRDYLLPILKGRVSMLFLGEIIDKTAKLDIASLENPQKVGVISRAYNRIHFQFEYYFRSIVNLFTTFIEVVLALVIFTIASPVGTVILIIANLINTIVKAILGGTNLNIYKANYETRLKFGYTTGLITQRETLLELKLFQNFKYVKNKILSIFNAFISKEISHEKRNQIIGNLVGIIPIVASFSFTLILAGQLQSNQISVGTFVFLFTNMLIFAGSLGRLSTTFVSIVAESDSIKDIIEFYELKPHLKYIQVKDQYDLNNWFEKLEKPEIYVQNVSFKYPNASTNALTNVSLKIPYSQNLALIGENGAGKSTLIKLILRVYDPDQGKITINDIDVKNIPIDVLYHLFGTLFQNFGKFNLTAKENLEIAANKKLSDEEMIGYLKYSNAWKFIESTKGKLNQQLGPEYSDGIDLGSRLV